MAEKKSTDDKIMAAFSKLILEQGYSGATTRKIAETAGINESTLFRHFKDKKNLVEVIAQKYFDDIKMVGNQFHPTGDISHDLIVTSRYYTEFIKAHQALFMLSLRDSYEFPELSKTIGRLPQEFYELLIQNFTEMMKAEEVSSSIDVAVEAYNFVTMNFGNAVMNLLYKHANFTVSPKQFEKNVETFANHLKA